MRTARALLVAATIVTGVSAWSGTAVAAEGDAPVVTTTAPVTATPPPSSVPLDDTTATGTTTPGDEAPHEDEPGFFDVAGRVRKAVNDWFTDLVNGAVQPVFELIGDRVFATPDFTDDERVRGLWLVSWSIANTAFVLFIVAAGALGMAHETLQARYRLKELVPRLVAGWVAANASLVLARVAIDLANALSRAFVAEGVGFEGAATLLKLAVAKSLPGAPLFEVLIALLAVVLALCLACVGIMRVCTVLVLVAAGPLFLIGYALPQTEGAARMWWRALIGCLGVQVGQAMVVTTALRVYFAAPEGNLLGLPDSAFMDLLVVTCLLWLALRIPSYARRLILSQRSNVATTMVRHHVVDRAVRSAATAAKAALAAAA